MNLSLKSRVELLGVDYSSQLRVAVAEAQGQFGNPEEIKRLLLEAVARGLVKYMTQDNGACNGDL
jgi:hypothetical protein